MQILPWLRTHPRHLFLIDGLGALSSAFLSGVVLVMLQEYVGIPFQALYLLASVPLIYLLFDLYCYFTYPSATSGKLYTIAGLNVIYCLLSAALLLVHWGEVLWPGRLYLIGETAVVAGIASFESRAARRQLSSVAPIKDER